MFFKSFNNIQQREVLGKVLDVVLPRYYIVLLTILYYKVLDCIVKVLKVLGKRVVLEVFLDVKEGYKRWCGTALQSTERESVRAHGVGRRYLKVAAERMKARHDHLVPSHCFTYYCGKCPR